MVQPNLRVQEVPLAPLGSSSKSCYDSKWRNVLIFTWLRQGFDQWLWKIKGFTPASLTFCLPHWSLSDNIHQEHRKCGEGWSWEWINMGWTDTGQWTTWHLAESITDCTKLQFDYLSPLGALWMALYCNIQRVQGWFSIHIITLNIIFNQIIYIEPPKILHIKVCFNAKVTF